MTAKEILVAAKSKIDSPDKWCQRESVSRDRKRMCALEAVLLTNSSVPPLERNYAGIRALRALMAATALLGEEWVITQYNDAPKRTHEEIMAWFDRAIERVS